MPCSMPDWRAPSSASFDGYTSCHTNGLTFPRSVLISIEVWFPGAGSLPFLAIIGLLLLLELFDDLVQFLEPRLPEAPVALEPLLKLAKAFRAQPVEPLLGARLHVHQPGLLQNPEMFGHLRLVEPEALAEVVRGAGASAQELDDAEAVGLGQGGERFGHEPEYATRGIFLSRHVIYDRNRSNVATTRRDASNAASTSATERSLSLGAEASSASGSGRSSRRSRSPMANASGSVVSSSLQASGVATVARGLARSEYGAITVAMGLFLIQSTKTRSPRSATRNTRVSSSPCRAASSAANFCTATPRVSLEADGRIAATTW